MHGSSPENVAFQEKIGKITTLVFIGIPFLDEEASWLRYPSGLKP